MPHLPPRVPQNQRPGFVGRGAPLEIEAHRATRVLVSAYPGRQRQSLGPTAGRPTVTSALSLLPKHHTPKTLHKLNATCPKPPIVPTLPTLLD